MNFVYEKTWTDITDVHIPDVTEVLKKSIKYRRDAGICFIIAEIDFVTSDMPTNKINIYLPQINDAFIPCENTIMATKTINGDEVDTFVRIKLFPGRLEVSAFPFNINTKYELNIQLFMCLTHEKFFTPLTK